MLRRELAPLFGGPGLDVRHVEDIGFKGMQNGALLAALSTACDVFVTGDTNIEHQQNLAKYDLAIADPATRSRTRSGSAPSPR